MTDVVTAVRFEPGAIYKCRTPRSTRRAWFVVCWHRSARRVVFGSLGKEYRRRVHRRGGVEVVNILGNVLAAPGLCGRAWERHAPSTTGATS